MTAIIKHKFKVRSAKTFVDSFNAEVGTPTRNHYLFIGKPLPWINSLGGNSDLRPPLPQDTEVSEARIWDEMTSLKKITRGDVSLVIPRSDWDGSRKTIYAKYDDNDPHLFHHPLPEEMQAARDRNSTYKAGNFYVLNDSHELFICVDNNNKSVSTFRPFKPNDTTSAPGLATNLVIGDDGYVWKYITTISPAESTKFLTDNWIPVKTLLVDDESDSDQWDVQVSAKGGEVLSLDVTNFADASPFVHHHKGKITVRTVVDGDTSGGKTAVLSTDTGAWGGGVAPSSTPGAYSGYQIRITGVEDDTDLSQIGKVFDVVTYVSTDKIIVTEQKMRSDSSGSDGLLKSDKTYFYETLPKVTVKSNGTQPIDVVPVLNATNKVVSFTVVARGENATWVEVSIGRPVLPEDSFTVPKVRVILSSPKGLGSDPENDLGACFVMMSTQLSYGEGSGDFPTENDYRQIGILRDVIEYDKDSDGVVSTTHHLADSATLRATKYLEIDFGPVVDDQGNNQEGFLSDDVLVVMDKNNQELGKIHVLNYLRFPDVDGQTPKGSLTYVQNPMTGYLSIDKDLVNGSKSPIVIQSAGALNGAKAKITYCDNSEVKRFDGKILYIENRRPILRSEDQLEDIKTIVEF